MNDHLRPTIEPSRALGRRPDNRHRPLRHRHRRRAQTRFTMLVHLPRKDGWGDKERVPALGGYGAESMREARRAARPAPAITDLGPRQGTPNTPS